MKIYVVYFTISNRYDYDSDSHETGIDVIGFTNREDAEKRMEFLKTESMKYQECLLHQREGADETIRHLCCGERITDAHIHAIEVK